MLFRFLSPLLLSVLLGAQPLHDQHTLESLIDATLKNHPSIRSSQQMITGAQAGVEGAKWGYFPTPSVELSQNSGRTSMSARLDQPLWTGGKLDAAVTAAEARKAESVIYLDETSYQLVSTLITLFRTYFHATESLKVLLEGKEQLLELQEMLQRRIAAGASSLSDGELIRSRLSQIDTELTAARINRSSALQQIEVLSGLTLDPDAEVRSAPLELSDESFETIILEMRASHPSLKKLDAQIQSANAERDRAKAVLWPNLSLRAEHRNGSIYTDERSTDNVIYVALSASTGAGFSALSNIQSAESAILQKQFEKQSKEKELIDAAVRDFNEYRMAKGRIAGLEQTIHASNNVMESYKRLFIAGKRQWLDLVNSSRELTQNKQSMADLRASMFSSSYQLTLKRGKLKLLSEGIQ